MKDTTIEYFKKAILLFPKMISSDKRDKEVDEMTSKMDSKILNYILEYAKMEADPKSMELHDHFDRETVSIARAISCRYKKLTTPSEGDELALMWANRKMGVRDYVCVPD